MLVSDIPTTFDIDTEEIYDVGLEDVEVNDSGLHVGDRRYDLNELTIKSLGTLLKVSSAYLQKCPEGLLAYNLNYWLREKRSQEATVYVLRNSPMFLDPKKKVVPLKPVAEIISRVFEPDDEVADCRLTDNMIHFDIISQQHRIEVPGRDIPIRPENDVTHGGIRIRIPAQFHARKPPEVMTYLNRRVCSNGMCIADAQHKLTLFGKDVDAILEDIESSARTLWEQLPGVLETYRDSANVEIPGDLGHFVYATGAQRGVRPKVMSAVMDRIGEIPRPATLYDVIQLFTAVSNGDVTYRTREQLQHLGGDLAADPEASIHRCTACQTLLT